MSMKTVENFIMIIHNNPEYIPLINNIFPYHLFVGTEFERICYIIPLITVMHESKTKFILNFGPKQFEFSGEHNKFEIDIVFSAEMPILIENSIISFPNEGNIRITNLKDSFKWNKAFYKLISCQCHDINRKIDKCRMKNIFTKDETCEDLHSETKAGLSSFYMNNNSEMIAKIWSIVLFFYDSEKIEVLKEFLHPIEADALAAIGKCLQYLPPPSISEQNLNEKRCQFCISCISTIIDITKQFVYIGKPNSILWKCLNNTFIIDNSMQTNALKALINCIEEEIMLKELHNL